MAAGPAPVLAETVRSVAAASGGTAGSARRFHWPVNASTTYVAVVITAAKRTRMRNRLRRDRRKRRSADREESARD